MAARALRALARLCTTGPAAAPSAAGNAAAARSAAGAAPLATASSRATQWGGAAGSGAAGSDTPACSARGGPRPAAPRSPIAAAWCAARGLRGDAAPAVTAAAGGAAPGEAAAACIPGGRAAARAASLRPPSPPVVTYRVVGRVTGPYGIKPKAVFAVVQVGGQQFKVTPDDIIYVEKLAGAAVNARLELPRVLLLGSATRTLLGRPTVPGAVVTAAVEEQFLDAKALVFKKRRRKNYRRLRGHRQPLTALRIVDVVGIDP